MRTIISTLPILAILLGGCASSPNGPSPSPGGTSSAAPDAPQNVPAVTGRALRVEWRNLNPRYGSQQVGLINRSSPELAQLYRNPAAFQNVKPVDDDMMANILAAFEESGYHKLATEGKDVRSFQMGDGNGVVSLTEGGRSTALFFPRMPDPTEAQSSPIPRTYRDLKFLIITIYNQTLWFAPSAPQDPDRVFTAPPPDRRR